MKANLKYEYKGQMMTISELMPYSLVKKNVLRDRLRLLGWDTESALTKKTACQMNSNTPSKSSVDIDISTNNKETEKKRKEVGMFAQCTARAQTK